jgi:CMP-N-acetylneuraminic acid synthetase
MWMNILPDSLSLDGFIRPEASKRRQDLPTYYRVNGAIYISDITKFENDRNLYDADGYAYVMDRDKSIDVDEEIDFELVKAVMERVYE